MKVQCPQCKKEVEYSTSNPHRPFCSERCKIIDLGDWASEKYTVPEENTPFDEEWSELPEEKSDNKND